MVMRFGPWWGRSGDESRVESRCIVKGREQGLQRGLDGGVGDSGQPGNTSGSLAGPGAGGREDCRKSGLGRGAQLEGGHSHAEPRGKSRAGWRQKAGSLRVRAHVCRCTGV